MATIVANKESVRSTKKLKFINIEEPHKVDFKWFFGGMGELYPRLVFWCKQNKTGLEPVSRPVDYFEGVLVWAKSLWC